MSLVRSTAAQQGARVARCQRLLSARAQPCLAVSHRPSACTRSIQCSAQATQSKAALPALQPLDANYESRHAFKAYANWIVPDGIMIGRYPFVEPSRCLSREQGEQQLEEILLAGISTFVCLQDEVPSQDNMKLGGKNGFLPYKSTAELIQSALNGPPPMELVDGSLRNPTLDKFLPPRRHHQKEQAMYNPKELRFLHCPIVDFGTPSDTALAKLVPDLQARLEAGEKLYIHCWGGRGRSALVSACLLVAAYGIGAEEALERVQRSYDTRGDQQPSSPETEPQKECVRKFAASLGRQ